MREMKDSGIEWIGEIPREWEVVKYKYFARSGMGTTILKENVIEIGIPIFSATQSDKIFGYILNSDLILTHGDLIIPARGNSIGFATYVTVERATCTQTTIYSKISNINKKFLYYCSYGLADKWFEYDDTAIPQITVNQIQNNNVPIPPEITQTRIATYLDDKCSKIDSIIEKHQKFIEKLKEYKMSVIDEAVVDESRTRCRLGYIGLMKNGLNYSDTPDGDTIKFLGVGDFKDNFILDNHNMFSTITTAGKFSDDYLLHDGDIVFVRSNGSKKLVGRSVMVNNINFPLTYSGFCIRFRNTCQRIVNNNYLLYFFSSPYFRKQLEKLSQGSNINNINQELLSQVIFHLPTLSEQITIVENLECKISKIDNLIFTNQTTITKLTEYKKSLIYEVVTGKKEV